MNMLLLVGTGYMAKEYAKVLIGLKTSFLVVGRGEKNCNLFRYEFPGITVIEGGLENFTIGHNIGKAIVASSIESLNSNVQKLLKMGVNDILLEKPGGKTPEEIITLYNVVKSYNAKVVLAYNRRFYSSTRELRHLASEDGGILSFNFEFTEWSHTIEPLEIDPGIKANWFLANSSHVVDTAFFLGGVPLNWKPYYSGNLNWHPSSSIFVGAGISEKGSLFSYQANWQSAGRWSIEVMTSKRRLILRPMELLQVQNIGEIEIHQIKLEDSYDRDYKPGLYLQTLNFLEGNYVDFCSMENQVRMLKDYYLLMSGYSS